MIKARGARYPPSRSHERRTPRRLLAWLRRARRRVRRGSGGRRDDARELLAAATAFRPRPIARRPPTTSILEHARPVRGPVPAADVDVADGVSRKRSTATLAQDRSTAPATPDALDAAVAPQRHAQPLGDRPIYDYANPNFCFSRCPSAGPACRRAVGPSADDETSITDVLLFARRTTLPRRLRRHRGRAGRPRRRCAFATAPGNRHGARRRRPSVHRLLARHRAPRSTSLSEESALHRTLARRLSSSSAAITAHRAPTASAPRTNPPPRRHARLRSVAATTVTAPAMLARTRVEAWRLRTRDLEQRPAPAPPTRELAGSAVDRERPGPPRCGNATRDAGAGPQRVRRPRADHAVSRAGADCAGRDRAIKRA